MAAAGTRAGAAPDMAGFELVVGGMTCAACAARVQAKLNKVTGVTASVNLSTERAYVTAPAQLSARDLIERRRGGRLHRRAGGPARAGRRGGRHRRGRRGGGAAVGGCAAG